MSEIYWITRLDAVNGLLVALMAISAGISLIGLLGLLIEEFNSEKFKKLIKTFIPIFVIFTLLYAFTPTKEDMFLIYGVGGTVDYIKQNDKAKQLPDKCINALDAWVDSLNDKNNNTK